MLIFEDTIFFGINDSLVIIPEGKEYKIQRNILIYNSELYNTNTRNKEKVKKRVKLYSDVWNKAYNYSTIDTTSKKKQTISSSELYFKQFEGKVIRTIKYNAVDMFEGQVLDTTKYAGRTLSKSLNAAHTTTRNYVIRHNLRFKVNDRVNANRLSENERLLRQLDYIEDARITVSQNNLLSDSVDITIITQDKLPLGIRGSVSDWDKFTVAPYINNFLGTGDYLEAGISFAGSEDEIWGYNINYETKNISGTFIDAGAYRVHNYEKNNYGFLIERPFLTTEMRVGGAFSYDNKKEELNYLHETIDTTLRSPFHSTSYDVWLAKTFILSTTTDIPNISIATRYYNNTFNDRPTIKSDSNMIFHDQNIWLSSAMVQKIDFLQTTKLSEFGVTEDVPIGYSIKFTTGYVWNEYFKRPYTGLNFNSVVADNRKGFISTNVSVGTFYNNENIEDAYISMNSTAVSPLKAWGSWEMRHCLAIGADFIINERYYNTVNLSLKNFDIKHPDFRDKSMVAMQYKPTFHMPHELFGFNFSVAPSLTIAYATEGSMFSNRHDLFTISGIDIRTKNESLIFPTLGMKADYYPKYGDKKHQVRFTFYAKDTEILRRLFSPKPLINKP